jgi:hypothetical protein
MALRFSQTNSPCPASPIAATHRLLLQRCLQRRRSQAHSGQPLALPFWAFASPQHADAHRLSRFASIAPWSSWRVPTAGFAPPCAMAVGHGHVCACSGTLVAVLCFGGGAGKGEGPAEVDRATEVLTDGDLCRRLAGVRWSGRPGPGWPRAIFCFGLGRRGTSGSSHWSAQFRERGLGQREKSFFSFFWNDFKC